MVDPSGEVPEVESSGVATVVHDLDVELAFGIWAVITSFNVIGSDGVAWYRVILLVFC